MAQRVLGMVLDTSSITLVRLTGSARAYDIALTVQQFFPQDTDKEAELTLRQEILRELVTTHHLQGDAVVITLPSCHAVVRNLTMPFKDPRRIRQTMKFALDEHIPFDPEDVIADFYLLPSPHANQAQLMVAAMLQETVASSLALVQSVGLEPTIIDLDVFSLANAAVFGSAALPVHTVLLDVQPTRTLVTLLQDGMPVFTRSLMHTLPADDTVNGPDAHWLSKHLQHTLYACEHTLQKSYTPDILLLSGASSEQLSHMTVSLQDTLGVPASLWRVTANAYKASGRVPLVDIERYAVAFGTAVRGMYRQAPGVNLRREQFALHRELQEWRGRLIGLGGLLLGVAALGLGSLYLDVYLQQQRYTQLQEEMAHIFRTALPGVRMVQPDLQLREKVRELEDRLQAFGGLTGAQLSGLQLLQEISARVPPALVLEVENLTIATDTIDLSGNTASYDDVVKLRDALEASPFLTDVKINNSKQSLTNKVDFKLTIKAAKSPESSS
jgi:Tfp pilus assembly PilM family ATPase/Tfp pilus assembly protein PilN